MCDEEVFSSSSFSLLKRVVLKKQLQVVPGAELLPRSVCVLVCCVSATKEKRMGGGVFFAILCGIPSAPSGPQGSMCPGGPKNVNQKKPLFSSDKKPHSKTMPVTPWIAEYLWVSGKNTYSDIRSKYKTVSTVDIADVKLSDMGDWNFDGSSTNQHRGDNTEIIIKPVAMYPHPSMDNAKAVLCECYYPDGTPEKGNSRHIANQVFDAHPADEPWFGLEQEYFIYKDGKPYMWPENGFPAPQGDYYCANGAQVCGREIALEHYLACLRSGLKISGVNAEVAPSQWEFQIGPCTGVEQGDHMTMARWIFQKIAEKYDLEINYEPKPIKGDWNGSGCHINFSTKEMREDGGMEHIVAACKRLGETFLDDVKFYGGDNNERMTGAHETSKLSEFTYGIGTRHTSVRIGNDIAAAGKGYYEDRRPASNIDPYLATARFYASSMGYEGPDSTKLERQAWWAQLEAEAAENKTA